MKFNKLFNILVITLSCGLSIHSFAQSSQDCSNPNKLDASDSTCIAGASYTGRIAQPKNHSAAAIRPFATLGPSCTAPWGQIVPDRSGVIAYNQPTGSYNYSTGTWADDCMPEFRYCNAGTLSGSYQYQECQISPVNGRCGVANGAYYTYPSGGPSTSDLCNPNYVHGGANPDAGPPSTPAYSSVYLNTSSNVYSWTCSGDFGGSSANCSAYRRINALCGADSGTNRRTAPSALCNPGNSGSVSGSGPWSWTCYGVNGGTNAGCYANKTIDGACGGHNNANLYSAPTALCNSGTASFVSGSGPWTWSCNGSYGGTNAYCSANKAVNGSCGSDNNATLASAPTNLCSSGTASAVSGSGPWTWNCNGSYGGSGTSCSANKATPVITFTEITDELGNPGCGQIVSVTGGVSATINFQFNDASGCNGAGGCNTWKTIPSGSSITLKALGYGSGGNGWAIYNGSVIKSWETRVNCSSK